MWCKPNPFREQLHYWVLAVPQSPTASLVHKPKHLLATMKIRSTGQSTPKWSDSVRWPQLHKQQAGGPAEERALLPLYPKNQTRNNYSYNIMFRFMWLFECKTELNNLIYGNQSGKGKRETILLSSFKVISKLLRHLWSSRGLYLHSQVGQYFIYILQ